MNATPKSKPGSLDRAIEIAVAAHAGVADKAGAPYILHPLRVMFSLTSDVERIVGVLHDVVEDSPDWSFERLAEEGFSREVLAGLRGVTKLPDEEDTEADSPEIKRAKYERFVNRAAMNPISRAVKLADLADNLDVTRLGVVTEKDARRLTKYLAAREMLLAAAST
jgi:(p)ppGpp synthase/HD superfamily hydrolase